MNIVTQKKYFVTYNSNRKYNLSNSHLVNLVKHSNFFDKVYNLTPDDLSKPFSEKYRDILQLERGGGYWIWKLDILNQLIESMNDNDLLLYMDSGSTFNYFGKQRFYDYCEILNTSDYGILNFSQKFTEREWTVKEIFEYFEIDLESNIAKTPQIEGTILLLKKNSHSLFILNEFNKLLNHDPYLITDKYNSTQKESYFLENRHDQSILSILTKKYGSINLKNETQFKNREDEQYDFPFLATRHRNQNFLFKSIYNFNLNKASTYPRYFLKNDLRGLDYFFKKYFYFNY